MPARQVEHLLFLKGMQNTRQIADHLGLPMPEARRLLDAMLRDDRLDTYGSLGLGGPGAPLLWSLKNQPDPMEPGERYRSDLDAVPAAFYKLNCARMVGKTYTPFAQMVAVVEVAPRAWRAYADDWGLGRPGFDDPLSAALALAEQVGVYVVPEKRPVAA